MHCVNVKCGGGDVNGSGAVDGADGAGGGACNDGCWLLKIFQTKVIT